MTVSSEPRKSNREEENRIRTAQPRTQTLLYVLCPIIYLWIRVFSRKHLTMANDATHPERAFKPLSIYDVTMDIPASFLFVGSWRSSAEKNAPSSTPYTASSLLAKFDSSGFSKRQTSLPSNFFEPGTFSHSHLSQQTQPRFNGFLLCAST